MPNEIKSEVRNGVLIVTFNRPEQGNALSFDMANQFFQVVKPVATDGAIRLVVLRGEGGNFMNGLDLGLYARDVAAGVERNNELLLPYHSAIRELHAMEKPVLAIVNGKVSGVGFSLMLASDFVVAGQGAKFSMGSTALGISPNGAATFFLPRKVGAAKAMEIMVLNEEFDVAEAERLHLVNAVAEDAQLQEVANGWIERLASGPTKVYGAIKRLVARSFDQELNPHISLEHTYWGACSRSFDFRAAVKAHLAKQPVKYTGS
jgi:2-(1,2-epoxy-1,2-dihydrophenyl)acetyl-CoA isomerase